MQTHKGNTQPSIDQEEHEGSTTPYTKRVLPYGYDGSSKNLFFVDLNGIQRSIVTVASVINTSFGGNVTLNPSPNFIGLATTVISSAPTLYAVVNTAASSGLATITLNAGTGQVGSVTVSNNLTFGSNVSLNASSAWIGLVSTASIQGNVKLVANSGVDVGDVDVLSIAAGNNNIGDVDIASIAAGNNNIGDVDIASIAAGTNSIGFATVAVGSSATLYAVVNTTASSGLATITLDSGTAQIGSVTVSNNLTFGSNVSLNASNAWIGLVSTASIQGKVQLVANSGVDIGDVDITSIAAGTNYIGFATVQVASIAAGANYIGLATTVQANQPALVASTAAIGFATVYNAAGTSYIGLASVNIGGTLPALAAGTAQIGSVTIANQQPLVASSAFIGLVTVASTVQLRAGTAYVGLASVNIGGTLPALAAGTNFIGLVSAASIQGNVKLVTNSGVDIGDVDVTSVVPGTGATNLGKAEDSAHSSTDTGVFVLSVRQDTPNATVAANGDYQQISTDVVGGIRTALYETDFAVLGTNHVKKYYTNAGAVTDGIIWSPAAGKRWYVTDIYIQVSAAATVTLEDDLAGGDSAIWKAELAANSGWSHSFKTPWFSGEDAADLIITTTAGNCYVTCVGYEI